MLDTKFLNIFSMQINKVMTMMTRTMIGIMIMTMIIIYLFCNVSCSMNHVCKAAIHGFETKT